MLLGQETLEEHHPLVCWQDLDTGHHSLVDLVEQTGHTWEQCWLKDLQIFRYLKDTSTEEAHLATLTKLIVHAKSVEDMR